MVEQFLVEQAEPQFGIARSRFLVFFQTEGQHQVVETRTHFRECHLSSADGRCLLHCHCGLADEYLHIVNQDVAAGSRGTGVLNVERVVVEGLRGIVHKREEHLLPYTHLRIVIVLLGRVVQFGFSASIRIAGFRGNGAGAVGMQQHGLVGGCIVRGMAYHFELHGGGYRIIGPSVGRGHPCGSIDARAAAKVGVEMQGGNLAGKVGGIKVEEGVAVDVVERSKVNAPSLPLRLGVLVVQQLVHVRYRLEVTVAP